MPPQPKLLDRVLISLKLKKQTGGLSREQAMQAWPVRNPALKSRVSDDGLATIELPRRKDAVGSALGFLFSVPESKPVQLDEVGSFVWNLCDGDHTVSDIIAALIDEYKLNRREVEVSLNQYLQQLAQRGIIAFAVPREIAEAAGIEGTAIPAGPAPPAAEADAALEPMSDFHPGQAAEPAPKADETTGLPPIEVEDILDAHPSPPTPLPAGEGSPTPAPSGTLPAGEGSYRLPAAEAGTTSSEERDDQEHPGGV